MCREWEVRLNEYVDGALTAAEREAVEGHIAGCAGCRAAVAELRELIAGARGLPRTIAPPRDLWDGIATRIAGMGWWRQRVFWGGALAAAAVLLIAFVISRPPVRPSTRPAAVGWAAVEANYEQAAAELAQALEAQRGRLRPETVAVVERNLAIIDAAIREASAALARDPNSAELRQLFSAAYRQKVELLQWATRVATPAS